jgi:murein DD-endopeptidase MepM/ murein hydrolase activator NlpD
MIRGSELSSPLERKAPSMLSKKNLTIMVLPSNPRKRVFSISLPILVSSAVFFASGILLFMASAGAWSMYRLQQVQQESQLLEMENRLAKSQIQDHESRIKHLTQEIVNIREKAGYVQSYLGLKPQGPGVNKVGQGGVELTPRIAAKASSMETHQRSSTTKLASVSTQDIRQLDVDLHQIVGALKGRQEKLDHTPSLSPVEPQGSWISSSYGMRVSPFTGKEQFHPGVDIAGAERTPILSPAKGTVAFVGKDGPLGMSVRIKHDSVYETTYGHLHSASVKKGQHVDRGEVIGHIGNSGRSTGHHLHYEIAKNGKSVNPLQYMSDWKNDNLVMLAE